MKLLTKEEQDAAEQATMKGAIIGGASGLALAGAAHTIAQRTWVPYQRNLTLPIKSFFIVSAGLVGFMLGSDNATADFEAHRYDPGKYSPEIEIEDKLHLGSDGKRKIDYSRLSTRDSIIEYAKNHRYQMVAGAWAASMVGSFGYIAMTPLSFSQKLVQARMWAQGLTVAVLIASAGLSSIPTAADDGTSAAEERRRQEESLYTWKKGSPHDLASRQGHGGK